MVVCVCLPLAMETPDIYSIAAVGLVSLWRWLWALLHLLRGCVYRFIVFPRYRSAAAHDKLRVSQLGVVITSYKMDPEINRLVALSLRADIEDLDPQQAIVVFSVGNDEDAAVIRQAFDGHTSRIKLLILYQDGSGKRRAMAEALSALRDCGIASGNSVLLMDGDTLVPRGALQNTIPILRMHKDIGALTVDNKDFVSGPCWVRDWYDLRMMQRHMQMCSLSLSERVLVLTGRWSLYRSELALHPSFSAQIARDTLHHWREGRIPLLTGEDKSTWRWIVEHGYKALYVPDVAVHPLEKLPTANFFSATVALKRRWYGNMHRGGLKAIPLGPRKLGWFPWLVLLDQKISMWTSLTGPIGCISVALLTGVPELIGLYFIWVLLSRTLHSMIVGALSDGWSPTFPFLMYYSQLIGSLIKVYAMFHPAQQKWTRQSTGRVATSSISSGLLAGMAFGIFVLIIIAASLSSMAAYGYWTAINF